MDGDCERKKEGGREGREGGGSGGEGGGVEVSAHIFPDLGITANGWNIKGIKLSLARNQTTEG